MNEPTPSPRSTRQSRKVELPPSHRRVAGVSSSEFRQLTDHRMDLLLTPVTRPEGGDES